MKKDCALKLKEKQGNGVAGEGMNSEDKSEESRGNWLRLCSFVGSVYKN